MTDTLELPAWLCRKLTEPERAQAWRAEPNKPKPCSSRRVPSPEELAIARGRERDAETTALLAAHHARRKQIETEERIAAIPAEAKAAAKLKKFKPTMANDAAPKRRKRRKEVEPK